jgi:hypothetical protein
MLFVVVDFMASVVFNIVIVLCLMYKSQ